MRTFEQWRETAHGAILWRTTDDQVARSALLDKVAATCVSLEAAGEVASIWHAHSLVNGHACNCARCRRCCEPA